MEIPLPVARLVGRDAAVATLLDQIRRDRLVTLVGPGGIGKTSLALSALAILAEDEMRDVCFVELSAVADPGRVGNAVASALQLPLAGEPLPAVLAALQGRRILIVLDNCEHVIMAAAALAEEVLRNCGEVKILATSREPLRCLGEALHRLSPLEAPAAGAGLTTRQIEAFPSVRLFAERAAISLPGFTITPANAETVAHVCRQLDGLPLALELAAACAGTIGLDALVRGLDDRLDLLAEIRPTAARHETLRALLDWSHDLLTEAQRDVLADLSVFRTVFSLEAAVMVIEMPGITRGEVIQSVLHLAAKSLLQIDPTHAATPYRMLDTTRAYASEKLGMSTRRDQVRLRHALYVRAAVAQAEADWKTRAWSDWWDRHGLLVEDIRVALDWAFSADGDPRLGIELTIASAPLWLGRSQLGEYWSRVHQALGCLAARGLSGGVEEMRLQLSRGVLLFNIEGPRPAETAAFERALEIAETLGDVSVQTTSLWALAGAQAVLGNYPASMDITRKIVALADLTEDVETTSIAQRMLALTHFRSGNLYEARRIGEDLIRWVEAGPSSLGAVYRYDQISAARSNLACVLWIQGSIDNALEMLQGAVQDAIAARNATSLCYILSTNACPIALWSGQLDLARHYIELLKRQAELNAFTYMRGLSARYWKIWTARTEKIAIADSRFLPGFEGELTLDKEIMITIEPGLLDDASSRRGANRQAGWCTAEMLRAQGERRLLSVDTDPSSRESAESLFTQALAIARDQGALSWELRAATSLARSRMNAGSGRAALDIIEPVLARFGGGLATPDIQLASDLVRALGKTR